MDNFDRTVKLINTYEKMISREEDKFFIYCENEFIECPKALFLVVSDFCPLLMKGSLHQTLTIIAECDTIIYDDSYGSSGDNILLYFKYFIDHFNSQCSLCKINDSISILPTSEAKNYETFEVTLPVFDSSIDSNPSENTNPDTVCVCDSCGQVFDTFKQLNTHYYTVHFESKQSFECQFCHKTFKRKSILTKHLLMHSDDRPFKCKLCNKSFKRKNALRDHESTTHGHGFTCTSCSQIFSSEKSLLRHTASIHNKRATRFDCDSCHKTFNRLDSYKRHVKSFHS